MKIAICDDSAQDACHLKELCEKCDFPAISDISVYNGGPELVKRYQEVTNPKYNIIFLDIDMPEINGLEVAKVIRDRDPDVIIVFTTSYDRYAVKAFDCQAFHYIIKPCSYESIHDLLERAIKKYISSHQYHVINMRDHAIRVPIQDIYYIEYCHRRVIYHLKKRDIEISCTLQSVISTLQPYGFYQIHQGYIVNLDKIYELHGFDVILDDGRRVPISIRKKTDVVMAFANYVQKDSI